MRETIRILALSGGIATESINRQLRRLVADRAPENVHIVSFPIETLPFFSQDLEADPPEPARTLKAEVNKADAVLFVTPEYNGTFPGVLKNALDWVSRPHDEAAWSDIPAAVLGASTGRGATASAQKRLRATLETLGMILPEVPAVRFTKSVHFPDGQLTQDAARQVDAFWDAWIHLVKQVDWNQDSSGS